MRVLAVLNLYSLMPITRRSLSLHAAADQNFCKTFAKVLQTFAKCLQSFFGRLTIKSHCERRQNPVQKWRPKFCATPPASVYNQNPMGGFQLYPPPYALAKKIGFRAKNDRFHHNFGPGFFWENGIPIAAGVNILAQDISWTQIWPNLDPKPAGILTQTSADVLHMTFHMPTD